MTITPEMQAILSEPFPPEQIGKLPRITCSECSGSTTKVCSRHTKARCTSCKQWITDGHIHLDYVGHAAVNRRLLKADPAWTWEPMYRDVEPSVFAAAAASGNPEVVAQVLASAPPRRDEQGGLWIVMTVGGVRRPGYGTTDSRGPDRQKMLISDAIRNAAMRFGVALDLWSKEDLTDDGLGDSTPPPAHKARPGRNWIGEANAVTDLPSLLKLSRAATDAGVFDGDPAVRETFHRRRKELGSAAGGRPTTQRGTAS